MKKVLALLILTIVFNEGYSQVWGLSDSRTETRDDAGLQGDAGAKSGFFQAHNPVNYPSGATDWWHLLDVRHSAPTNNFAMQFAGSFWDQNLYFRKTTNSATQPWSRVLLESPDGKVGIGTLNPENTEQWESVMEVYSNSRSKFQVSSSQVKTGMYAHNSGFYGALAGGIIGTSSPHPFSIVTNKAVKMTIDIAGNVGIGTTTPTEKLTVNGSSSFSGTVRFQGLSNNTTYSKALVADNNGNLFYRDISSLQGSSGWGTSGNLGSDPARNFIGTSDNQPIVFRTNNAESMRIAANGNVGIGTASPSEKLAVNGNVRAKKVIVTQSNWPDYVFEISYKLPSLDSISSFIKANKHLPEMPSATAIEKDGQDVGEIQKLLLKKVEELTLYVIELKEEIEKLKK